MALTSKRTSFIAAAGAAFGSIAMLPSQARAAQFVCKIGSPDGDDFPITLRLVQLARSIREQTNGRMELQVFPNSALGSPTSMIAQLRLGSLDFVALNHSLYSNVVPVSQINGLGFAFPNSQMALTTFDGPVGAYVRKEFAAKGMLVFPKTFEAGFKQVSSTVRAINKVDDFAGFRIRSVPAPISVELFKTLGASPIPLEANETFTALQTHIVDGIDDSLASIDGHKFYDVEKFVSITNHAYSGYWMAANAATFAKLPDDLQATYTRLADQQITLERRDIRIYNDNVITKLKSKGMAFNTLDAAAVRPKLGAYYAHWKNELGLTVWNMLEASVGKLA